MQPFHHICLINQLFLCETGPMHIGFICLCMSSTEWGRQFLYTKGLGCGMLVSMAAPLFLFLFCSIKCNPDDHFIDL